MSRYGINPTGKEAVVVGRSNIVGKPMALLLLARNATVTICHTRTKDLAEVTRRADILVAAAGRAQMIKGDMVKKGVIVIDVRDESPGYGQACRRCGFCNCSSQGSLYYPGSRWRRTDNQSHVDEEYSKCGTNDHLI